MKRKPTGTVAERMIEGLEEFAGALEQDTAVSTRFTIRQVRHEFRPTHYDARKVKATRNLLAASQAVFANYLGVSVRTVRAWEQGINTPSDLASRFMDEIRRNPEQVLNQLRDSVR